MPLIAIDEKGLSINSRDVTDRNQRFTCAHCGDLLSFVDARLKVKHFRHKVNSTCAYETEPETTEHAYYKQLVYDYLKRFSFGNVYLEHRVGSMFADVYWKRPDNKDIAFEVQATNTSFSLYEKKICYYL